MSFSSAIKRMSNESLPIGGRYRGLLEALERGHLTYSHAWSDLERKFGVRIGDPINSEMLQRIASHLVAEREQWLQSERSKNDAARRDKFERGTRRAPQAEA